MPGGRILSLTGGDLQVVDRGPRDADPIVLIHCFTCAIDWWDGMRPALEREAPRGGDRPARVRRLRETGLRLFDRGPGRPRRPRRCGGSACATRPSSATRWAAPWRRPQPSSRPSWSERLVIVDQAPNNDDYGVGLPFTADLTFMPVIGPALWRVTARRRDQGRPQRGLRAGLRRSRCLRRGLPPPDLHLLRPGRRSRGRLPQREAARRADQSDRRPAAGDLRRRRAALRPATQGPRRLRGDPGAKTALIPGAGHSPNVERPARTASLILAFARHELQEPLQKRDAVRNRP